MAQMRWREIVESADNKDRNYESLYPVVYKCSNERVFRDTGPQAGVYKK